MQAKNDEAILAGLREVMPELTLAVSVPSSASHRDTLDDYRRKAAKKLRDNKLHFDDKYTGELPDKTFIRQPRDLVACGIKAGNRWLRNAIAGKTYVRDVSKERAPVVLERLAEQVEAGLYDNALRQIMNENDAAAAKRA